MKKLNLPKVTKDIIIKGELTNLPKSNNTLKLTKFKTKLKMLPNGNTKPTTEQILSMMKVLWMENF